MMADILCSSHWFLQQPVFSSVHLQLLQLAADKLMKVGEMQPPDPVVSRYIAIDFDTREGFAQFFGMCKGKVLELTKLLASLQVRMTKHSLTLTWLTGSL
jgi:hypothetical protein